MVLNGDNILVRNRKNGTTCNPNKITKIEKTINSIGEYDNTINLGRKKPTSFISIRVVVR